ncbi:hypothetical protein EE612_015205 [Oryza sativa]|nr:hypothetical protein EE612_015205 [Oryza sativa]
MAPPPHALAAAATSALGVAVGVRLLLVLSRSRALKPLAAATSAAAAAQDPARAGRRLVPARRGPRGVQGRLQVLQGRAHARPRRAPPFPPLRQAPQGRLRRRLAPPPRRRRAAPRRVPHRRRGPRDTQVWVQALQELGQGHRGFPRPPGAQGHQEWCRRARGGRQGRRHRLRGRRMGRRPMLGRPAWALRAISLLYPPERFTPCSVQQI